MLTIDPNFGHPSSSWAVGKGKSVVRGEWDDGKLAKLDCFLVGEAGGFEEKKWFRVKVTLPTCIDGDTL